MKAIATITLLISLVFNTNITESSPQQSTNYSIKSALHDIQNVIIISPGVATGGVENLCQIAHELQTIKHIHSYVLWAYNDQCVQKKECNNSWYLCKQDYDFTPEVYKDLYNISYLNQDVPLDNTTLIILPEIWCDLLPFFESAQKMIAWLSIGNINGVCGSESCRTLIDRNELYKMPCFHITQAPWIQKWITTCGALAFFVGDYISPLFIEQPTTTQKIPNSIAYYPTKGKELAQKFINEHPKYFYIKLEKMTKDQMVNALDQTQIYIDFGNFPGMDRTPREAAARNCLVFLHAAGCAVDFDSFPISDFFRFTKTDLDNNFLYKKVDACLHNYEKFLPQQSYWRLHIKNEHTAFKHHIHELFE